ncbi:hypothetical protein EFP18_20160 [Burkholderia glumae]|uniref:SWIM zinc finger family protein n=1 Tax=Burkholderia glumae TaxID=337 RepID=UPI000F5E2FDA|nr:DUF6880 family protein [Burkholderia glumae]MCQ0032454.1 hypothetical protein [Burkholderia glumae]MCQ0038748.1 hypothetical protein [Burkholderia glumae]MCR1769167.1 hypothetical protein [Burkholderia glumae]QHP93723.1 hypothetical protein EXE55_22865 [Burkholderia glumae]QJP69982.1 hypothetical protein HJC54_06490 [Burkholderia glumae]
MTQTLADTLTLAAVLALADEKTVARGLACFHDGAVSRLQVDGASLHATVRGGSLYSVQLGAGPGKRLTHACDCPVGARSQFCKHAVAVAFSWLENSGTEVFAPPDTPAKARTARKPRRTQADLIDDFLATLDLDALRGWLREAAQQDRGLRDKLLLAARASSGDKAGLKAAVRRIARASRHLDWREAGAYAAGLAALADSLRERLDGTLAGQVAELAELAIELAVESFERIDDSGGAVLPAVRELAAVHLDACMRTRPEPVALAQRLHRLQLIDDWRIFDDVLPNYAQALGVDGLSRYRELVDTAWDALPALGPGRRASYDGTRLRLEAAKLALARFDADVDALVAVLAKDLSSGYRFLLIAEACAQYGRDDEAIAWALRGMAEAGAHPDTRLHAFCIDAYLRRGDAANADAVAWRRFLSLPTGEAFEALMCVAAQTGSVDATRTRALAHLRDCLVRAASATGTAGQVQQQARRTELVKALLSAGDADAAWQVFNEGAVSAGIWAAVAAARARTHPHDAIALYHRLLPSAIERGTYGARYEQAFELVQAIAELRSRHDEQAEFAAELDAIRTTHRAKRNFIKLLDSLA